MSFKKAKESFSSDLEEIKKAGLWKTERIINSDQKSKIQLSDNQEVIIKTAQKELQAGLSGLLGKKVSTLFLSLFSKSLLTYFNGN